MFVYQPEGRYCTGGGAQSFEEEVEVGDVLDVGDGVRAKTKTTKRDIIFGRHAY